MLAEEDKATEVALRYWFACCDLDGDGHRRGTRRPSTTRSAGGPECLGHEAVAFADVARWPTCSTTAQRPAAPRRGFCAYLPPGGRLLRRPVRPRQVRAVGAARPVRGPHAEGLTPSTRTGTDTPARAEYARLATEEDQLGRTRRLAGRRGPRGCSPLDGKSPGKGGADAERF